MSWRLVEPKLLLEMSSFKSFYNNFLWTLMGHLQGLLVFYNGLWSLSWKPLPHPSLRPHWNYMTYLWEEFFFVFAQHRNSHYYWACCYTNCKHESLFQKRKQPYNGKTCLALKIRRTTWRPIIKCFLWLVRINIHTISINFFSTCPNHSD